MADDPSDSSSDSRSAPDPRLRRFGGRAARVVLVLQVLALLGYAVLHSPLVGPLTRLLHLRRPDFCYFVCR